MGKKFIFTLFFVYLPLCAMDEYRVSVENDLACITYAIERGGLDGLREELQLVNDRRGRGSDVTVLINQLVACIYDRWYASRRLLPVAICLGGAAPLLGCYCGMSTCLTSGFLFVLSKDYELRSSHYEKMALLLCTAQGVTFDRVRLTPQAREFVAWVEQKNK